MVVKSVLENERRALRRSVSDTRMSDELFKSIPMGKFEVHKDSKGHVVSDPFIVKSSARLEDIQKLLESPDEDVCDWIQPGSTIVPDSDTQDSPKHYLIHNLSEKIHYLQDHIHMPFHDHSGIIHHYNQPGLLETAMATMLIEKLNICEASAGILPVEISEATLKESSTHESFVNEVRKRLSSKLNDITRSNNHHSGYLMKRGSSEPCFRKYYIDSDDEIDEATHVNDKTQGKGVTHKDSILKSFKEKLHHLGEHMHTTEVKGNIVEKFHKLQEKVHLPQFRAKSESRKHHGLLETAMQTILIDKANLMETQVGTTDHSKNEPYERKNSLAAFKKRLSFSKNLSLELPIFGRKKRLDSDASVGKESVETLKNESLGSNRTIKTMKETSPVSNEAPISSKMDMLDDNKDRLSLSDSNLLTTTGVVIDQSSKFQFFSLNDLLTKESHDLIKPLCHTTDNTSAKADNHFLEATYNTPLNLTNQSSLHASPSFTHRNEVLSSPFHPRTESISASARPQQSTGMASSSIGRETPSLAVHHRRSSDSDLSITPKGKDAFEKTMFMWF